MFEGVDRNERVALERLIYISVEPRMSTFVQLREIHTTLWVMAELEVDRIRKLSYEFQKILQLRNLGIYRVWCTMRYRYQRKGFD